MPRSPCVLRRQCMQVRAATSPGRAGVAVKLMTGAPVPRGVTAVVMIEHAVQHGIELLIRQPAHDGENIRLRAGDCRTGDQLAASRAARNTASCGADCGARIGRSGRCIASRLISLLTTGNELVAPGGELAPGMIFDSNTTSLEAALQQMGLQLRHCARCQDDLSEIAAILSGSLREADCRYHRGRSQRR